MKFQNYIRYSFLITLLIFIVAAGIVSTIYVRMDMSRDKSFSITPYSKEILKGLDEQVNITYYLSPRLKSRFPFIQEISDLLYEYQRLGKGKVVVNIVDPEANPDQKPETLGIQPQQMTVYDNNQQTQDLVYSGITISYLDNLQVIPFIADPSSIEYELTSRILALSGQEHIKVGMLLGTQDGDFSNYSTMTQYLGQYYDVQQLHSGDVIPPTLDTLLVVGAASLTDSDLYQVEQFMLSGKGVLFAAESAGVNLQQNLAPVDFSASPLMQFLQFHGVTLEKGWVADKSNMKFPVQTQIGGFPITKYEDYPLWPSIQGSAANPDNPLTSRFAGLDLYWASPLTPSDDFLKNGGSVLLSSSNDSTILRQYNADPYTVSNAMLQSTESEGSYPLMLEYQGPMDAYYSEPPRDLSASGLNLDDALKSADKARMLVIGDSDFASNLYQYTKSGYNIYFMQDTIEYLGGDSRLLEMRTRGNRDQHLDAISDPVRFNALLLFTDLLSMILIPLAVILYGLIRYSRRRRRSKDPYFPESMSAATAGSGTGNGGSADKDTKGEVNND